MKNTSSLMESSQTSIVYNKWQDFYLRLDKNKNRLYLSLIPFINVDWWPITISAPDSLSGLNKLIFSTLIFSVIILWCIINIIGYFGSLYIVKYTDLESKYPKFKPIFKYYLNTSTVFLVIEIVFVLSTLLLIIGICLHLLYMINYS